MLRFKLLRAIFVFLIVLTIAVIVFFFFSEDEGDIKTSGLTELKKSNRTLIMKDPSIEWGEHQLSAKEMEVLKDKNLPQKEIQVFRDFIFKKKSGNSGIEITGDKAILETSGDIETFTQIRMSGSVKCKLASGWYVSSSSLIYRQGGLLDSETPVTFGSKNANGSAERFFYNSTLGKVSMSGNINLTVESTSTVESAAQPLTISFQSLEYDTNTGDFVISGGFSAVRDDEFLTGKSAHGLMNPGTQKILSFDVLENARMCFKETAMTSDEIETDKKEDKTPFNFKGLKVISSPVIKFSFRDDEKNNIKSIETVKPSSLFIYETSLNEKEKLRIYANEFTILSSQKNSGLEKMTADGKVEMTQILKGKKGNTKRVITCKSFEGSFGENGIFTKIRFLGGLKITEPAYSINSESGVYNAQNSLLTFDGSPLLVHQEGISAAENINFDAGKNILILDKNVVSRIKNTDSANKVFNEKEDIYINSSGMTYNSETNTSIYKGNVIIYQEKSEIFSDSIELNQKSKLLIAKGKTRGRIYDRENDAPFASANSGLDTAGKKAALATPESAPKQKRPEKSKEQEQQKTTIVENERYIDFICDKATIDESNNLILLEKKARVLRSSGEEIKGERIEYTFKDRISEPVRTEATGNASFKKLPYESTSEYLYYDYEKDLITLKGPKVILFSMGKPLITARELTFTSTGDIINIKSLPGERIEAVWKTENKAKGDQEVKKKK
jgi:lipopolysaccharide export system protein LptA